MNNTAKGKVPYGSEGLQSTAFHLNLTTPTQPDARLHEMHHDLDAALTSTGHFNEHVIHTKVSSNLLFVPRTLYNTPAPKSKAAAAHLQRTVHKPIERWLAEKPKDTTWNNVGAVTKEQDGKNFMKPSSHEAGDWSARAQDGSENGHSQQ
jgi:hypothetical protein